MGLIGNFLLGPSLLVSLITLPLLQIDELNKSTFKPIIYLWFFLSATRNCWRIAKEVACSGKLNSGNVQIFLFKTLSVPLMQLNQLLLHCVFHHCLPQIFALFWWCFYILRPFQKTHQQFFSHILYFFSTLGSCPVHFILSCIIGLYCVLVRKGCTQKSAKVWWYGVRIRLVQRFYVKCHFLLLFRCVSIAPTPRSTTALIHHITTINRNITTINGR